MNNNQKLNKIRESLTMFRATLNSLKYKESLDKFEYPQLIEVRLNGSIDYDEQIKLMKQQLNVTNEQIRCVKERQGEQ